MSFHQLKLGKTVISPTVQFGQVADGSQSNFTVILCVIVVRWLPNNTVNQYIVFKRELGVTNMIYWVLFIGHLQCVTDQTFTKKHIPSLCQGNVTLLEIIVH